MKNKTLRILVRAVAGILLLILLLLIGATVYVHFNKEKLVSIINTNINKKSAGKFDIKSIDLSTFSHSPTIAVDLEGIALIASVYHRPLLEYKLLSCSFNIF